MVQVEENIRLEKPSGKPGSDLGKNLILLTMLQNHENKTVEMVRASSNNRRLPTSYELEWINEGDVVLVWIGPDAVAGGGDSANVGQSGGEDLRGMGLSSSAGHPPVHGDAGWRAVAGNYRRCQRSPQDGRRYSLAFPLTNRLIGWRMSGGGPVGEWPTAFFFVDNCTMTAL